MMRRVVRWCKRKRWAIDKHRRGWRHWQICFVMSFFFFLGNSSREVITGFFARSDGFGIRNKKLERGWGFYFSSFFLPFLLLSSSINLVFFFLLSPRSFFFHFPFNVPAPCMN